MRRYLVTFLGLSAAVVMTALGCSSTNTDTGGTSAGAGGGGGGTSTGGGPDFVAGGGGAGASYAAEDIQSSAPIHPGNADSPACVLGTMPKDRLYFSRPNATATASGALVRGVIAEGKAPLPSVIRPDEILDYYHITCPTGALFEEGLSIVPALFRDEAAGDYVLQVVVCAPPSKVARPLTALTILVDTSKSMAGESMTRTREAVKALALRLNLGDTLTLLTTDPKGEIFTATAGVDGVAKLGALLAGLTANGGDDLNVGLKRAYKSAKSQATKPGELHRVVLITDGGMPGAELKTEAIEDGWATQQIQLVGVGVGDAAGYHDELLTKATQAGHGAKLYLDSVNEAKAMLGERFNQVFAVAAREVTVSVDLPWFFDLTPTEAMSAPGTLETLFKSDLAPGRSMVFRRALHTCAGVDLSELGTEPFTVGAHWTAPDSDLTVDPSFPLTLAQVMQGATSDQALKIAAIEAFASALLSLDVSRLQRACATVAAAEAAITKNNPNGPPYEPELTAILAQIKAHPLMKGQACQ